MGSPPGRSTGEWGLRLLGRVYCIGIKWPCYRFESGQFSGTEDTSTVLCGGSHHPSSEVSQLPTLKLGPR